MVSRSGYIRLCSVELCYIGWVRIGLDTGLGYVDWVYLGWAKLGQARLGLVRFG